jgi:hypothetical protein
MKKRPVRKLKPALITHHSKTGKKLPHAYTSYPLLVMLLLVVGVFIGGMTLKVKADDYSVNAAILAPLPTVPAVIVSPVANTHFSTKPITVNGSCQAGQIVKLYRNNIFSGTVFCQSDSTFQIQTDLFDGTNDLEAKIFNITNGQGPTSTPVRVYYDPPVTPSANTGDSGKAVVPVTQNAPSAAVDAGSKNKPLVEEPAGTPPFVLSSDGMLKGYFTGDTVELEIDAEGGTPPYAISVNWGDGKSSIISRKDFGKFNIKHVYSKAGRGYKDSYDIKMIASDGVNNKTFMQLTIIVHDKNNIPYGTPGIASTTQLPPMQISAQLKIMLPVYGATTLVATSFWLVQGHHLARMRPRIKLHK